MQVKIIDQYIYAKNKNYDEDGYPVRWLIPECPPHDWIYLSDNKLVFNHRDNQTSLPLEVLEKAYSKYTGRY